MERVWRMCVRVSAAAKSQGARIFLGRKGCGDRVLVFKGLFSCGRYTRAQSTATAFIGNSRIASVRHDGATPGFDDGCAALHCLRTNSLSKTAADFVSCTIHILAATGHKKKNVPPALQARCLSVCALVVVGGLHTHARGSCRHDDLSWHRCHARTAKMHYLNSSAPAAAESWLPPSVPGRQHQVTGPQHGNSTYWGSLRVPR